MTCTVVVGVPGQARRWPTWHPSRVGGRGLWRAARCAAVARAWRCGALTRRRLATAIQLFMDANVLYRVCTKMISTGEGPPALGSVVAGLACMHVRYDGRRLLHGSRPV